MKRFALLLSALILTLVLMAAMWVAFAGGSTRTAAVSKARYVLSHHCGDSSLFHVWECSGVVAGPYVYGPLYVGPTQWQVSGKVREFLHSAFWDHRTCRVYFLLDAWDNVIYFRKRC